MKSEQLLNAIGEIDDGLIEGAAKEAPKRKKPVWVKWSGIAACLALFAIALGGFQPFRREGPSALEMTAYAMGADGELTAATMEQSGQPVVLSKIELGSGFSGFLFSIPAFRAEDLSTVSLLSSEDTTAPLEGALNDYLQEKGMLYFYYIPAENETMPVSFTVYVKEKGIELDYAIRIEASENGYTAIQENASVQTNGGVEGPLSVSTKH